MSVTPLSLAGELARLRQRAPLTDRDIAHATCAAPSTVRSWLTGARVPSGERADRLLELAAVVERLARVVRDDAIVPWLRKPLDALDNDKPLDLIAAGEYRRVSRLVSELETFSVS